MNRFRLGLTVGIAAILGIVAYLGIPGHWLGTFFYNAAPPLFRQTVAWEQSRNALFQTNGQILWSQIENHVTVSLIAGGVAVAACLPLGIVASRQPLIRSIATNMVGAVRAVPGVAVIFLMFPLLGLGELPGIIALTLLAAPPIFLNTVAGYGGVDRAVVESARGMGMSRSQILAKIETPLAAPVVIAGIRIAMVEIIASATILAYSANFSTLGSQISYGLDDLRNLYHGRSELAVGVVLVASLALAAELLLTGIQRVVAPVRR